MPRRRSRGSLRERPAATPPPLLVLERTRERANSILGQNASNTAKALARDALELCDMIDDFRSERHEREADATPADRHAVVARIKSYTDREAA